MASGEEHPVAEGGDIGCSGFVTQAHDPAGSTYARSITNDSQAHDDPPAGPAASRTVMRQQALRELFHSPKFNVRDGLDDYAGDYNAYTPLGTDIVTADRRHRLERQAEQPAPSDDVSHRATVPDGSATAGASHAMAAAAVLSVGAEDDMASRPAALLATLPAKTADGRARAIALEAEFSPPCGGTSMVVYHSRGHLLIIGSDDKALALARPLAGSLHCTVLADTINGARYRIIDGVTVAGGELLLLEGHLGRFTASVSAEGIRINVASELGINSGYFDLVLDLNVPPVLSVEVLPPGYFAPGDDPVALPGWPTPGAGGR